MSASSPNDFDSRIADVLDRLEDSSDWDTALDADVARALGHEVSWYRLRGAEISHPLITWKALHGDAGPQEPCPPFSTSLDAVMTLLGECFGGYYAFRLVHTFGRGEIEPAWCSSIRTANHGDLDDAASRTAHAAAADACTFATARCLTKPSGINFSEQGLLSLEWERQGLLLVFSGDGEASSSCRSAHDSIYRSTVDFRVDGHLPGDVLHSVPMLRRTFAAEVIIHPPEAGAIGPFVGHGELMAPAFCAAAVRAIAAVMRKKEDTTPP